MIILAAPLGIAKGQNPQELMDAAIRSKTFRVQRTFENCMSRTGSREEVCKTLLETIHKREVTAIITISKYFDNTTLNKPQLYKEFNRCQTPQYDYSSSILCFESLATRLYEGAQGQSLFLK